MQGFNMGRYVPPDAEGVLTANQASGKGHALGRRAAKLRTEGALTVRFEMPFAVWCDACSAAPPGRPQLIGQGVRFNAEKRRVGSYHSTPVYSFRMRHAACGGWLEVRTDPARTTYDVVAGGRRRATAGDDRAAAESLVPGGAAAALGAAAAADPAARDAQRASAFSSLERTIEDRAALAAAGERIDAIGDLSARHWDDPYARNQALRRAFRVGRRQRERDGAAAEELRDRMGLGIELLPESEEDARRARLVDFGTRPEGEGEGDSGRDAVLLRPLFGDARTRMAPADEKSPGSSRSSGRAGKKPKSEVAASRMRESLVSEIVGNTRLATDPFLEPRSKDSKPATPLIPGLKRKRDRDREPSPPLEERPAEKVAAVSSALVDYDSD